MKALAVLSAIVLLSVSCGSTAKRQYNVYIKTDSESVRQTTLALMERFNMEAVAAGAGHTVLVPTPEPLASGRITFADLPEGEGGEGSWGVRQRGPFGEKRFYMELVFDRSLFEAWGEQYRVAPQGGASNTGKVQSVQLFRLFCHEVGHGLGLDHSQDETSVMSYKVTGNEPGFEQFFQQVANIIN